MREKTLLTPHTHTYKKKKRKKISFLLKQKKMNYPFKKRKRNSLFFEKEKAIAVFPPGRSQFCQVFNFYSALCLCSTLNMAMKT